MNRYDEFGIARTGRSVLRKTCNNVSVPGKCRKYPKMNRTKPKLYLQYIYVYSFAICANKFVTTQPQLCKLNLARQSISRIK